MDILMVRSKVYQQVDTNFWNDVIEFTHHLACSTVELNLTISLSDMKVVVNIYAHVSLDLSSLSVLS